MTGVRYEDITFSNAAAQRYLTWIVPLLRMQRRVELLSAEKRKYSSIEDAEYDLFNVNGFSNQKMILPGASSWDYKFVIKVDPSDIHKWLEGRDFIQVEHFDTLGRQNCRSEKIKLE